MKDKQNYLKIIVAFIIIYFVWGTTYLANAWAVESMPAFMVAGVRYAIAGLLMLCYTAWKDGLNFSKAELKAALFSGVMLFVVGNGMMLWTLRIVDSGIVALIVATRPLLVILFLWKLKKIVPSWNSWLGILLGGAGMLLLVGQGKFVSDPLWMFSVLVILIATSSWAYISVWVRDAKLPESIVASSGLQMFLGGMACLLISIGFQEYQQVDPSAISIKAIASWAYLVVFGSIVAFTAFNYLLQSVSPAKVNTNTFVNPVIAMLVGAMLNSEVLSIQSILAAILLLTGVVFINVNFSLKQFFKIKSVK